MFLLLSVYDLFVNANAGMIATDCAATLCVERHETAKEMVAYEKLAVAAIRNIQKAGPIKDTRERKVIRVKNYEENTGVPTKWQIIIPEYDNLQEIAAYYTDLPYRIDPKYMEMALAEAEDNLSEFGKDMKTNVEAIAIRLIVTEIIRKITK